MTIEYRVLHDPEELISLIRLQIDVWSMADGLEAVPHNLIHAIIHGGGNVIRADQDGVPVGFTLALVALEAGVPILWSHMAGVIPALQGHGIGFRLKYEQRKWALEHGYKTIAWSFDPLQRGNANFNLRLLKATASTYHANFYGVMTDGINAGMPSDRMVAVWALEDDAVAAAEFAPAAPAVGVFPRGDFLLDSDGDGAPHLQPAPDWTREWLFAEIPRHISALKHDHLDLAKSWQMAERRALGSAFEQGYVAVDFADDGQRCWYILRKF